MGYVVGGLGNVKQSRRSFGQAKLGAYLHKLRFRAPELCLCETSFDNHAKPQVLRTRKVGCVVNKIAIPGTGTASFARHLLIITQSRRSFGHAKLGRFSITASLREPLLNSKTQSATGTNFPGRAEGRRPKLTRTFPTCGTRVHFPYVPGQRGWPSGRPRGTLPG